MLPRIIALSIRYLKLGGLPRGSIFGRRAELYAVAVPIFMTFFFTLIAGAIVARIRKATKGKM